MSLSLHENKVLEKIDLRTEHPTSTAARSAPPPWASAESPWRRQRGTEPDRESLEADQDAQDTWGTPEPFLTTRRALFLSLALVLVVAVVVPPAWSVVVPLVLAFVILPWLPGLTERAVEWIERRVRRVPVSHRTSSGGATHVADPGGSGRPSRTLSSTLPVVGSLTDGSRPESGRAVGPPDRHGDRCKRVNTARRAKTTWSSPSRPELC